MVVIWRVSKGGCSKSGDVTTKRPGLCHPPYLYRWEHSAQGFGRGSSFVGLHLAPVTQYMVTLASAKFYKNMLGAFDLITAYKWSSWIYSWVNIITIFASGMVCSK